MWLRSTFSANAHGQLTERISVTPAEYETAHANPRQFMVVTGHADDAVEDTVAHAPNYDLVVKRGEAGVDGSALALLPAVEGDSPHAAC